MNELQIFTYQSSEVRTVTKDGEPWFVLKDVCAVLGIVDHKVVTRRLEKDEVCQIPLTDRMGRKQTVTIINESGLYTVILRSDKLEAKPFRKWVTGTVLPAIRKTGGYLAGQENMSAEELMAKALVVAQKTLADREARLSALTVENQIMKPKADYFDELVDRNLLTSFRETAKQLEVGERDFIQFLLNKKYIYRDKRGKLMPYAQHATNGLFEIKECFNDKTQWKGTQTMVTPKGRETLRQMFIGGA